jgi:hypothetical protein
VAVDANTKAQFRADFPEIAEIVDSVRASGGGIVGMVLTVRDAEVEFGKLAPDPPYCVEIEIGDHHIHYFKHRSLMGPGEVKR